MTSWFLECQIEGLQSKLNAIRSDWESLNRSLCDSELDDYNSMLDALIKAQATIDASAIRITGSSKYPVLFNVKGDNENGE